MQKNIHEHDAKKANVEQYRQHDCERMGKRTQCIAKDLQKYIDKVEWERDADDGRSKRDDLRVLREQSEQMRRQQDAEHTYEDREQDAHPVGHAHAFSKPVPLRSPCVLADEYGSRLTEGYDRVPDEQFDFKVD